MKCLICGGESAGEVCNKCIRLEKIIYQKEWDVKVGGIFGKKEGLRVAISNLRISGRLAISDNPRGLNTRFDNVAHYLLNLKEVSTVDYQNRPTLMLTIKNDATGFERYLFLPGFEYGEELMSSISDAKEKAKVLTDRLREGTTGSAPAASPTPSPAPTPSPTPAPAPAPEPVAAPEPAPTPSPAPVSYDTVVLSSIAEDVSEFETKIKKLKVLRDNGILSEEEYQAEKKKLVSIF